MPVDAKTNENFKDYILGFYDEQPKTPEWASKICGTAPDDIRDLARQMATVKPMSLKASCAPGRTYYGNRWTQLFYTIGWMTGNVGKLGAEVTMGVPGGNTYFGGSELGFGFSSGYQIPKNPICTEAWTGRIIQTGGYDSNQEYGIALPEVWKAIVTGEYTLLGQAGEKHSCDIKCIVRDNVNQAGNQYAGIKYFEEAMRKVEFVVITDMFLARDAQYADIVLPSISTLEMEFSIDPFQQLPEFIVCGRKVIEPYFESKSDPEIAYLLAEKLGIGEEILPRMSLEQAGFNKMAGAYILTETGEMKSLFSITPEDIDNLGVEGIPQEGHSPLKDFLDVGAYQIERHFGDFYANINVFGQAFVENPEKNPVQTPSGKFEIHCKTLKDYNDKACFSDIDALPKYKASLDGYEQALADPEYPLQMISVHTIRTANSMFSNVKQLCEISTNDLLMSNYDVELRGLQSGEWVQVVSREGTFARRLRAVPYVMPGVVLIGQGHWSSINQETKIDEGGNPNTCITGHLVAQGDQAYNSCLVDVVAYNGPEILSDYKRPLLVPIAG
jgi:anaerobic dimethyl sulfoxide reductase subunit A